MLNKKKASKVVVKEVKEEDKYFYLDWEEFIKLYKEEPVLGKLYKNARVVYRGDKIKLERE